jgi:hypothetical protein
MNIELVLNVLATAVFPVIYWLHRSESAAQTRGEQARTAD